MKHCVLAGGCFWCMAKPYYEYDGIINVYSGYPFFLSKKNPPCSGQAWRILVTSIIPNPSLIFFFIIKNTVGYVNKNRSIHHCIPGKVYL